MNKYVGSCAALTAGVLYCLVATARAETLASDGELAALRQSSRDFVAAFNEGDAKAVAALWTEDGEYIDEAGRMFAGREAIEQEYSRFFADHKGVQIRIVIDSVKLLSETAAIEDGRAMLEPAPAGAPATSKYTAVHVKVNGKWLMSTVRDSRVETPSAFGRLQDLEWLVGKWTAEEHGAKMEVVCRWIADKSFLERKYTLTKHNGTAASGVQIIGYNPQAGHVQSWTFASDGGHAVGVWTPRENGWAVETQGMAGDGSNTSAINVWTRIDDQAYAWQSVRRTLNGETMPDTDEVVLRRSGR